MIWVIAIVAIIYATGFTIAFIVSGGGQGPADMQLTLLRSTVWPWYLTTGRPTGTPYPMD